VVARLGRGRVALGTVILDGIFFAGFSAPFGLFGAAAWAFGWGAVIFLSLIAFTTLFQEESPERMRGRILALLPPLQGAGLALAHALIAGAATGLSEPSIALLGGLVLILCAALLWILPAGRRFGRV
jgi:hypothetical protein